jgi:hypothetical protein
MIGTLALGSSKLFTSKIEKGLSYSESPNNLALIGSAYCQSATGAISKVQLSKSGRFSPLIAEKV